MKKADHVYTSNVIYKVAYKIVMDFKDGSYPWQTAKLYSILRKN